MTAARDLLGQLRARGTLNSVEAALAEEFCLVLEVAERGLHAKAADPGRQRAGTGRTPSGVDVGRHAAAAKLRLIRETLGEADFALLVRATVGRETFKAIAAVDGGGGRKYVRRFRTALRDVAHILEDRGPRWAATRGLPGASGVSATPIMP